MFVPIGQFLNKEQEDALEALSEDDSLVHKITVKHRRIVGLIIPAFFFHTFWWAIAIQYNLWYIFKEKYYMSITMIFGSIIAGNNC